MISGKDDQVTNGVLYYLHSVKYKATKTITSKSLIEYLTAEYFNFSTFTTTFEYLNAVFI